MGAPEMLADWVEAVHTWWPQGHGHQVTGLAALSWASRRRLGGRSLDRELCFLRGGLERSSIVLGLRRELALQIPWHSP